MADKISLLNYLTKWYLGTEARVTVIAEGSEEWLKSQAVCYCRISATGQDDPSDPSPMDISTLERSLREIGDDEGMSIDTFDEGLLVTNTNEGEVEVFISAELAAKYA